MKKAAILVIILVLGTLLTAQVENRRYLPVAETDGFWSPLVNPAALGFGNSSGFAWVGEDYDGEKRDDYHYWFFNMDNLAYVFHRDGTEDIPADRHTLAFGTSIFARNFYLGINYDWLNKYFNDGEWGYGALWRPDNHVSLAGTAFNVDKEDEAYRLGMSIRPLAANERLRSKLTLSADMFYLDQGNGAEDWQKPVVSLSSEFIPGFCLRGSYDLENETIAADLSVAFSKLKIGNLMGFDEDKEYVKGNHYLFLSEKEFDSILNADRKGCWYVWKLSGEITEQKTGFDLGPITISSKKEKTLSQIIKKINKLKEDDSIKGIVFKNPSYSASFAARQELCAALMEFKSAGKQIVYYADNLSSGEYYLAAAVSDAIYLNRNGGVDLKGLSVTVPYFKTLLDTLGVDVTNFQSHEYKTAFNSFSYDHMTDAERETYDYLLDGVFHDIKEMILAGREDRLMHPLDEIIDNGPYLDGGKAFDNGLVDYLIYEDELQELIKDEFTAKNLSKKMPEEKMPPNWHKPQKDKIAVIYAVGSIVMGEGKPGRIIGSETTAKAIRKAREDKSVKGIILRVDSGGGSAFASDVINREIELCKEGKNKKPVIASMAGAAASGGYYISCNADLIIAQSSTITGSIGVIGMWPSFQRLYEKIYINWATVKKGEHSDFGNTSRQPRDDEIELVKNYIDKTYNDFLVTVARGRSMSKDDVHKVAMGRVWTGSQALDRGLVDKIGGMKEAVEEMKILADISGDVKLEDYSRQDNDIRFNVDMEGLSKKPAQADLPAEFQTILSWWDYYQQFKNEKAALILPIRID